MQSTNFHPQYQQYTQHSNSNSQRSVPGTSTNQDEQRLASSSSGVNYSSMTHAATYGAPSPTTFAPTINLLDA
ncbi:hypothetical protein KIN20_007114 [Parelaphostrongylus tenuis]|uniref:Uncharacterized protein n=1 Tax=Parelaphostrongylus tenuis TaxID=148309 RepID=A0AAD5ML28_PARTN|nr:hypothetical protein KIN20_007114 [Parelaphostrongylus tenuis]